MFLFLLVCQAAAAIGELDVEAWQAPRVYVTHYLDDCEQKESFLQQAEHHVSRCGARWDVFFQRAVELIQMQRDMDSRGASPSADSISTTAFVEVRGTS